MGVYVVLTAWLFQRGSAESRDPDEEKPEKERIGQPSFLYSHSLGLTLFGLFIASFYCTGSAVLVRRKWIWLATVPLRQVTCNICWTPNYGLNPSRTGSRNSYPRQSL